MQLVRPTPRHSEAVLRDMLSRFDSDSECDASSPGRSRCDDFCFRLPAGKTAPTSVHVSRPPSWKLADTPIQRRRQCAAAFQNIPEARLHCKGPSPCSSLLNEAGPRRVELLIKNSGLQSDSEEVNTPGWPPRDSSQHLSVDQIELQFARKELATALKDKRLRHLLS